MDFKINTNYGEELDENDWINITNLVKNFSSKFTSKRSHNVNYYKNKLLKSPYGKSILTRIVNEKKECLGLLTLTKKSFKCSDDVKHSYELGDVYIIQSLQGKNLFKDMIKKSFNFITQNEKVDFIYATPNNLSIKGLTKNGFKVIKYDIFSKVLPLRIDFYFKHFLFKYPMKLLIGIYLFILNIILKKNSKNDLINVEMLNDLQELPDKNFYNHDIQQDRSKNYINWRFKNNPDEFKIYKVNHNKNYIGYTVFKDVKQNNIRSLYLADISINKDYLNNINSIISKILIDANINQYAYVSMWLSKKSIFWKTLGSFFLFKLKKIPFIVKDYTIDESFYNIDNKKIHFTLSDSDNI